jgi:pseudouridine synthase
MEERLQKFLARAGVGSRRGCETIILEGRVTVNGSRIDTLGTRVDPTRDAVKVDGKRIRARTDPPVVLALNKPRGYVTTVSDPQGRPTVMDLVRSVRRRVYPVGRLDFHSDGLLLLTDDGALARDLMHPRKDVAKWYRVKVRGKPTAEALRRIERGMVLDGKRTLPAKVRMARPGANAWIEIAVTEGRNRLVRRLFEAVGHPVQRLRRTAVGPIKLGRLPVGSFRTLLDHEVDALRAAVAPAGKPGKEARRRPR